MKTKKWLTGFFASLCLAVLSLVTACAQSQDNGGPKPEEPKKDPSSVSISYIQKDIELFQSFTLSLNGEDGIVEASSWCSSDDSVATVSAGGVVLGKTVGNAEITAVYNEESFVCKVSIVAPEVIPNFGFDNHEKAIKVGASVTFDPTYTYSQGQVSKDDIVYDIDESFATVEKTANGACVVSAVSAGKTVLSASVDWYGIELYDEVEITISDNVALYLEETSEKIYKYSDATHPNTAQLAVREIANNGKPVVSPSITWTSDDPSIATVDQTGLVRAVSNGLTMINCIWDNDGTPVYAYCSVEVAYYEKDYTETKEYFLNKDCVITLSGEYAGLGNASVTDGENKKVIGCTNTSNAYTLNTDDLTTGDRILRFRFENGLQINVAVRIGDLFITTVEELLSFRNNIEKYSYVVLGKDIELGNTAFGKAIDSAATVYNDEEEANDEQATFNGVFDGKGHTVFGGQYGGAGLFRNIGKDAVVKNIQIKNASLHSWTHNATMNTTSIFANDIYGEVRNVYIVCEVTRHLGTGGIGGNYGTAVCRNAKAGAKLTNIIVYWKTKCWRYVTHDWFKDNEVIGARTFVSHKGSISSEAECTNCYSFNAVYNQSRDVAGDDRVQVFDYTTTCKDAGLDSAGFDDIWYFGSSTPIMNGLTFEISTKAQLLEMYNQIDNVISAKLLNDIDLGETVIGDKDGLNNKLKTFNGVFDGQNHSIKGGIYEVGGLFQNLGENGEIRNVAFTGALLHSRHAQGDNRCWSIVANDISGTIDNVLIDAEVYVYMFYNSKLGWDQGGNYGSALGNKVNATAKISNVVLYFNLTNRYSSNGNLKDTSVGSASLYTLTGRLATVATGATFENVYVFNSTNASGVRDSATNDDAGLGIHVFDLGTTCKDAGLDTAEGFGTMWNFSGAKATMSPKE